MTSTAEEKAFINVAVAAIPRVAEIILGFPPDDQAGALEMAERRFLAAASDYGCTEIAARSRVSVIMRRLRSHLERQRASERSCRPCFIGSQDRSNPRSRALASRPRTVRSTRGAASSRSCPSLVISLSRFVSRPPCPRLRAAPALSLAVRLSLPIPPSAIYG